MQRKDPYICLDMSTHNKQVTYLRSKVNTRQNVQTFEMVKPYFLILLDRYKIPFCSQRSEDKQGYLVSKDGQQRRQPFRVQLNKLNKSTTIKFTSIKVRAYTYITSYLYTRTLSLEKSLHVFLFLSDAFFFFSRLSEGFQTGNPASRQRNPSAASCPKIFPNGPHHFQL